MAERGYIEGLLQAFDPFERRALSKAFEEMATFIRFGDPREARAINLGGVYLSGTTSSVANQEVAVAHQLGTTPYLMMPVCPLDSTDCQVVPLQVSRAADNQYLYLQSSSTGAQFTVYLEG